MKFKNFFECIGVCDNILKTYKDKADSSLMQCKMLKGKARFYSYKRKLQHALENPNVRLTKEGSLLLNECFNSIKEAITLLGDVLDCSALDEEGSKLLDWAMIDCLSLYNQLNKCRRCFLCRQNRDLRRSHVTPKFIVDIYQGKSSDQDLIFGLDEHQLKSAGQCYYYMLCGRCEQLMTQNGESDFKANFPSSGEITYSSWLFSFCTGIIFRSMGIALQFPMHFNDEDIYKVLLHCREHLLQLPVKIDGKVSTLEFGSQEPLNDDLDIFLFMSPHNSQLKIGVLEIPYPKIAFALSRNKQLSSRSFFFNGQAHFFFLACGPITLIVQFDQTLNTLKNKGFHITSSPTGSDSFYHIPSAEDQVKLLPVGIWPIVEQLMEGEINKVSRFIAPAAKVPTMKPLQSTTTTTIPGSSRAKMFIVSYLPREFEVVDPHVNLPRNKCVILPEFNHVVIHASMQVPMNNSVTTFILCFNNDKKISDSKRLYLIFVMLNDANHHLYVDGVATNVQTGKIVPTDFLLHNPLADSQRLSISQMESLLNRALPNKYFDNINVLMKLVKGRR